MWIQLGMAACLLCAAPAVAAQGPEQLDQLEPGAGDGQAEYFVMIGPSGSSEHAIEAMFGVSDRLAIGFEVEAEHDDGRLVFETLGPKLLYRLTPGEAPVAIGLQAQLGFDADARLVEAETRLIVEAERGPWWAQGNLMLRRVSDGRGGAVSAAYAWSLQHAAARFAWFGIEASGQSAPLSGALGSVQDHGHFAGPSLTVEWEPTPEYELEFGIAYLRRISGEGPIGTGRLFAQFSV